MIVSIHAPAWGATPASRCQASISAVSIHAPAWGATRLFRVFQHRLDLFQFTRPRGARLAFVAALFSCIPRFNSRARVGRDVDGRCIDMETRVSIHAPAWGATSFAIS